MKINQLRNKRGLRVRMKILNPGPQEAWTPLTLKKSVLPSLPLSPPKFSVVFKPVVLMRISLPIGREGMPIILIHPPVNHCCLPTPINHLFC